MKNQTLTDKARQTMKNIKILSRILLSIALVYLSAVSNAQSPEKVSYQSVIRDASGELVRSQTVGIRISILQGSAGGTAVYVETHSPETNINGLATIEVGNGTPVSGTFSSIDWSDGPYFLKVETDPEGGNSYSIAGTSEIMSVPYALHAKTAENVSPASFKAPTVTTLAATSVEQTSATLNGTVNPNGFRTTACFEWGTTTGYGSTTSSSTFTGIEDESISKGISGLQSATTYHFRLKAENAVNTSYGADMIIITGQSIPQLTTSTVTSITDNSASSGGNITYNGGSAVTARGVCWNTTGSPTISDDHSSDGTGTGSFSSSLSGLSFSTVYYVRAYATNSSGTAYGNELTFETYSDITESDVDGNLYNVLLYGEQNWFTENLKTTKLNDGTAIPNVTDDYEWSVLTTPAYCWYDNNISNKEPYGGCYNGYSVYTDKLCPTGWRVPNDVDWILFIEYLSYMGYGYEGSGDDIAKSIATNSGWDASSIPGTVGNDQASNNATGFNAYPAGYRSSNGYFNLGLEGCALFMTLGGFGAENILYRELRFSKSELTRHNAGSNYGLSVRCIKDEISPAVNVSNITGTSFDLEFSLNVLGEIYYIVVKKMMLDLQKMKIIMLPP